MRGIGIVQSGRSKLIRREVRKRRRWSLVIIIVVIMNRCHIGRLRLRG